MKNININIKTYILLLFVINVSGQNYETKKVIIDKITKQPLEYVNIFNKQDFTVSNQNGYFVFYSNINEIKIKHLGYKEINTSFENLKKIDTIKMQSDTIKLNEIVISDKTDIVNNAYKNITKNYPFNPFNEQFFIRCIVRKNNKIIKIQDVSGIFSRETLFKTAELNKNNYILQINNLRKTGINSKSKEVEDFNLLTFRELIDWLSTIFTSPKDYKYWEDSFIDNNYYKVNFSKKATNVNSLTREGYYVIDKNDFSFNQVYYNTTVDNLSKIPFKQKRGIKWRTLTNELLVNFKKNEFENIYYINKAKLKNIVEVVNNSEKNLYEASYELITTKSFIPNTIKSNYSIDKDLFIAKFDYSEKFWSNQNQLPLTNEIKDFLNGINELKDKKSDFYIMNNF